MAGDEQALAGSQPRDDLGMPETGDPRVDGRCRPRVDRALPGSTLLVYLTPERRDCFGSDAVSPCRFNLYGRGGGVTTVEGARLQGQETDPLMPETAYWTAAMTSVILRDR